MKFGTIVKVVWAFIVVCVLAAAIIAVEASTISACSQVVVGDRPQESVPGWLLFAACAVMLACFGLAVRWWDRVKSYTR